MSGRIMIVEDESLVAEDIYWHLKRGGYEVVGIADTFESARALADTSKPDLVLLDIRLKSDLDGIDLAQELHRQGIGFVYLTSHADDGTLSRAETTEPLGYVLKPFGAREIMPVVQMAMYRHRAELRLRNMEQWLQMTLRSIGDGVIVCDRDGYVTFTNPVAEQILGGKSVDLLGRSIAKVLRLVDMSSGQPVECIAKRALEAGQTISLQPDVDIVRADGSRLAVEDCASPIHDDGGRVTGAVIVVRDASDRRQYEQQRREAERKLQTAERLESLGTLAGGLAHDMNNILTAILGNVALCREPGGSSVDVSLREIEINAKAAADLCHRMLVGSSGTSPVCELVDAVAVAVDCIAREHSLAPANVTFATYFAAERIFLWADVVQFRQVVQNLLRNAVEALDGTGGTIAVRIAPTDRAPADREAGEPAAGEPSVGGPFVRIDIEDDGPGMPPEVRSRIFEPFFSTKFTGRGLGLASVHGIVRRHHGFIEVESVPGAGTTMHVLWPTSGGATERARSPAVRDQESTPTVLIVDDDPAVRDVTRRMLLSRAWRCHVAAGGEQALEMLQQGLAVDVVLLDTLMPGMHGLDVLAAIRRIYPSLPVLLMSGFADHDRLRFREASVEVLEKPFTLDMLVARLQQAMPKR